MLLGRRELIKAALRGLLAVVLGDIPQLEADAIQAEPDPIRVEPDVALEAGEPVREVRQPTKGPWLEIGGRLYPCVNGIVEVRHDMVWAGEELVDSLSDWSMTAVLKRPSRHLRDLRFAASAVDVILYAEGMVFGGRGILTEYTPPPWPRVHVLADGELKQWTS